MPSKMSLDDLLKEQSFQKNLFLFFAQWRTQGIVLWSEDVQWWAWAAFEVKRSCELVMVENDVYSFQDKNEMWPKKLPSFQTKKINCELVVCGMVFRVWVQFKQRVDCGHIFFKWIIFGHFFETVFSCRPRSALKKNKNALKVSYHQQRSTFFPFE